MPVEGVGVEAPADWDHLHSPETYLGYGRSERFSSADSVAVDEPHNYELAGRLRVNHWSVDGRWTIGARTSHSTSPAGASPTASTRATHTSYCPPERESRLPFVCSSTARRPAGVWRQPRPRDCRSRSKNIRMLYKFLTHRARLNLAWPTRDKRNPRAPLPHLAFESPPRAI